MPIYLTLRESLRFMRCKAPHITCKIILALLDYTSFCVCMSMFTMSGITSNKQYFEQYEFLDSISIAKNARVLVTHVQTDMVRHRLSLSSSVAEKKKHNNNH